MIQKLIDLYAGRLKVPEGMDAGGILFAIYQCERYRPWNRTPRFEKAYAPGGALYERSPLVRDLYDTWGKLASCSYSNFQIMYPVAVELGYIGPPVALDQDKLAIEYVVRFLNVRAFGRGAKTVEQVADTYNSGTFKDSVIPYKYVKKFVRIYEGYVRSTVKQTSRRDEDAGPGSGHGESTPSTPA